MSEKVKCPACDTEIWCYPGYARDMIFYVCPICGKYELSEVEKLDYNHLASYLLYNGFKKGFSELRYHTVLDKELCDKYKDEFDKRYVTRQTGTYG